MARTGGVLTFCMIAAVVLGFLLMLVAQNSPAIGLIALLLFFAAFVMWFVVMIALKVNLDQNNYHRAGGLIWTIIALTVLMIVIGIVAAVLIGSQFAEIGDPSKIDPSTMVRAFGIWGIILGVLSLIFSLCFLMLGVRLNEYGAIGGGAWKGAGIVLIIATVLGLLNWVLYILAAVAQAPAILIVAGIVAFIALILWGVVWIMIGIGFMSDANRMAMAQAR